MQATPGVGSIMVTWAACGEKGITLLDGYYVEWRKAGDPGWIGSWNHVSNGESFAITGLNYSNTFAGGGTFEIRVTATDDGNPVSSGEYKVITITIE